MILVYAFANQWGTNISRRVLLELQKILVSKTSKNEFVFLPIYFHPRDFYKKNIEHNNYSIIIGLGDSYGLSSKIKIETQAKNVYNDQSIYPFAPILVDLNIPVIDNIDSYYFKISSNMGTYNCNWIAFSTQLYLNQNNLQTKHLFLHLPPKSNAISMAQRIDQLLADNHIL